MSYFLGWYLILSVAWMGYALAATALLSVVVVIFFGKRIHEDPHFRRSPRYFLIAFGAVAPAFFALLPILALTCFAITLGFGRWLLDPGNFVFALPLIGIVWLICRFSSSRLSKMRSPKHWDHG